MWTSVRRDASASVEGSDPIGGAMTAPAGMPPATVRMMSANVLSIANGRHDQCVDDAVHVRLDDALMTAPIRLSGRWRWVEMTNARIIGPAVDGPMVECAALRMRSAHLVGDVRCDDLQLCPNSTIRGNVSVAESPCFFSMEGKIDGELSHFGNDTIDGQVRTLKLLQRGSSPFPVYLGPRAVVGTLIAPADAIVGMHPQAQLDSCPAGVRIMSLDKARREFDRLFPPQPEAE